MNKILIKKCGEIFKIFDFSSEQKKLDTLKRSLFCQLEIEENTEFGVLFDLIMKDKEYFDEVFYEEMGGLSLSVFEEEWVKEINEDFADFDRVVIEKHYELIEDKILTPYSYFRGEKDNLKMNLEFTPINELKNIILNLNHKTYLDWYDKGVVEYHLTLYEVISAILYGITFYGTPKDRDKAKDKILGDDDIDNLILVLEEEIEEAIKKEDYEEAESIKQLLNEIKNK